MMKHPSRRSVIGGGAAAFASIAILRSPAGAAQFEYKYAHNLPIGSPLHVRTTQLWAAVKNETGGRLAVSVYPNNILGGDAAMLTQLRSGAIQFYTMAGPLISSIVPVAAIEFVPFVFPTREKAWAALDGALGANTRAQIDAMGLYAFDKNFALGFYQITNSVRPIRGVDDMAGLKIRVGPAKLALDTFRSLGAAPTPLNFSELYSALQTHVVDGQYNPYAIIEVSRFFEVQKYVTEVNLCWASYYMMANGDAWKALPPDIQAIVIKNVSKYALLQRADTELLSAASADKLERQGMTRNVADPKPFRAKLVASGFYERWKAEYGEKAWSLLEVYSGKLT